MANPIQFESRGKLSPPDCQHCEELLADAVDDILSPADRTFFDLHVAGCAHCSANLADAVRGAAWLELLKAPRPEPSAGLVDRILLGTSGSMGHLPATAAAQPVPVNAQPMLVYPSIPGTQPANVLAFPPRASAWNRLQRLAFEPRLAMTAAMAFFSIALTLNITGVRLDQLHPSDLSPGNLKRSYYAATASAARRYDSLRVVHVLESRVDDMRELNQDDAPARNRPVAAPQEGGTPANRQPGNPPTDDRKQEDRRSNGDHGMSKLAAPADKPNHKEQPENQAGTGYQAAVAAREGGLA